MKHSMMKHPRDQTSNFFLSGIGVVVLVVVVAAVLVVDVVVDVAAAETREDPSSQK